MMTQRLKEKARVLKRDVMALFLAYKRPDVPWFAKLLAILVVGYALSPVDLIPDFIPVLGCLDDLILLPLGVGLVIRLIPDKVMRDCRVQAEKMMDEPGPRIWGVGLVFIAFWAAVIGWIVYKIVK